MEKRYLWHTRDIRRRHLQRLLVRDDLTDERLVRALDALDHQRPKAKPRVHAFRLYYGLDGEEPMSAGEVASRLGVKENCVRARLSYTQRRLQNPHTWQHAR